MTTVYLIRHAEAEGNVYRRIHGQYDSLITPNGERQLEALAERFQGLPLDAVYASDLYRTRRTAAAAAKYSGLPVQPVPGLRELALGQWEDMTWGEVERRWPEKLWQFNHQPELWAVEGGEPSEVLRRRLSGTVRELVRCNPDRTIVVASHGMAIRALTSVLLGLSCAEMDQVPHSDNTGITVLRARDAAHIDVISAIGDIAHLSEELSTFATQHWWKKGGKQILDSNLWFRPLEPGDPFPDECRRAAWQELHGDLDYYNEGPADSRRRSWAAMLKDTVVGVVETEPAAGRTTLFWLLPEYRNGRLGPQLLGQAVSACRSAGSDTLSVLLPRSARAVEFFRRWGFREAGYFPGADVRVPMLKLELPIAVPEFSSDGGEISS